LVIYKDCNKMHGQQNIKYHHTYINGELVLKLYSVKMTVIETVFSYSLVCVFVKYYFLFL